MKVKVNTKQSLIDIAIQEYGAATGVIFLLRENPNLEITSKLAAGSELFVNQAPINAPVMRHLKSSGISTAAAAVTSEFNNDFNNDFN